MLLTVNLSKADEPKPLEWLSDGTTWYHDFWTQNYDTLFTGYVKTVVTGDSVIDAMAVKVLRQEVVSLQNRMVWKSEIYLYNEGNKVYFHTIHPFEENIFSILYDFDALPGDTLLVMEPHGGINGDLYPVVIDSVYTVEIQGREFKAMDQRLDDYLWHFTGQTIEYIGFIDHLLPKNYFTVDLAYDYGSLRCFSSGDFSWHVNPQVPCDTMYNWIYVNTENHHSHEVIKLFPNPASSGLFIEFSNLSASSIKIEIIDMKGAVIKKDLLEPELLINVNINHLEPGPYIIRLFVEDKWITKKFIKK